MTAINVVVQADAIYIFTDGAAISPTGELMAIYSKVRLFPHLSAVMATRGSLAHSSRISMALSEHAESFDALIAKAPTLAGQVGLSCDGPHGSQFDMVLAGWSEAREAFEAYQLAWRGETSNVVWTHERLPSMISPFDDAIAAKLSRVGIGPGKPCPAIRDWGRSVMTTQRKVPTMLLPGGKFRSVGAFCQMTVVRREGINTELVERWPADKIGRPIGSEHTAGLKLKTSRRRKFR